MTIPGTPFPVRRRRRASPRRAAAALALGGLLAAAAVPARAAPAFANLAHSVGGDPAAVAAGDFDGDGRIDLAVANRWTEDLSILPGLGGGNLGPERRFAAGGIPVALAVADFNGDGRDDLAVALPVEDRIAVFLSGPGGTPGPPLPLPAGDSPGALLAADLDGDGAADLAVVNYLSDDVVVLAGRGDGTFGPPAALPAGLRPHALVAGLFDADLHADLAIANEGSGDVTILLGDGGGGFRRGGDFPTGAPGRRAAPRRMVAADFDRDGALDLVVGDFDRDEERNAVVLLRGRGDGGFAAGILVALAGDGDLALGAADFNRDGRPDLAFGAHHGASCCDLRDGAIVLGRGDLGFDPAGGYRSGPGPVALAAAHLDGDAAVDLAVISDAGWDQVAVNLGRGDGAMGDEPALLDPGGAPADVALGDVDGDGLPDVAVADPSSGGARVMRSRGGGRFDAPLTLPTGGAPVAVAVGDYNGDHLADVAVLDAVADDIALFTAIGGGLFADPVRLRPASLLRALAAAEVTGDGIDDLVVASAAAGEVIVLPAPGAGAAPPLRLPAGSADPRAVAVADLDGDGLRDIVVAGEALAVLRATAPGRFAPPAIAAADLEFPPRLAAGDLDGDGRADLVASHPAGAQVHAGRGDGGLDPGVVIVLPPGPRALALADVDADGAPEILALDDVAGNADVSIVALRGPAAGAHRRLLLGAEGAALAAGDLDGDGRVDLAVADTGRGVLLSMNVGPFPNRPPRALPAAAAVVECSRHDGAVVALDGRASTDPDSSPENGDDRASFAWYEDYGGAAERLLAEGAAAEVVLPLGAHALTLVVVDRAGAAGVQGFGVEVADTTPPAIEARAAPALLWPPNHRMVPARVAVAATDACGPVSVVLESATSSEPDDAPGSGDGATLDDIQEAAAGGADFEVRLRAERAADGSGRVYTLVYRATDLSGNVSTAAALVTVPRTAGRSDLPGSGGAHRPAGGRGRAGKTPPPALP